MNIFKAIFIVTFLGLGSAVAHKIEDCEQIRNFVKGYVHLLNQLPWETSPVNSFCTSNLTVSNYQKAVEQFHYAQGNKSCEVNLNQNRLNVFQTLYDQMQSIWDAAHCQDCVSNRNDTAEFFGYYDEMQLCTKIYTNPCDVCAGNYSQMQVFYEGLAQSRKGQICFDIEDRMNQTRYAWSATYNCCKGKQHSTTAFIWLASSISSLPVVFYIMMYFMTRRKESRERAAAPLLNDQSVAGPSRNGEERPQDQRQASTSSLPQQRLHENGTNADDLGSEPKLNNLDKAPGVRESKLIDLDSESNRNLNPGHDINIQSLPSKQHDEEDDDDVSILRNPNVNAELDNLLD